MNLRSFSSLLAIVLVAFVLTALSVAAQAAPPTLDTWDTQVWPEFDQPSVLVITTGSLASGTTFPQQVRVPIPAAAQVHAVAYPEDNGNLLSLNWTVEPGSAGQNVVFELNQNRFVVEYYADILSPPPARSFELNLVAPYAAQQASLALRQPSRASNLQTTPLLAPGGLDALGNPTYTLDLGEQAAGQNTLLQVSYTKPDAQPSVTSSPSSPTGEAAAPTSGGESVWLPWVVGVAAGLLVGAVIFYLLQRRSGSVVSRQSRRRAARKQGGRSAPAVAGGKAAAGAPATKFCVQCGQKFEGVDKFCRNCGAPRR